MLEAIKSRGVSVLIHFTRIENLDSILTNGLVPRQTLTDEEKDFIYNDDYRIDGYENATCCSISFPNYKMFYSLRMKDAGSEWVVLGISPHILIDKDVAFCKANAASTEILQTSLEDLQGVDAFLKLFENYDDIERVTLGIPDNYTTNPQAEVLVFDIIEPKYIIGLVVQTKVRKIEANERYPQIKQVLVNPRYFKWRKDFEYWKK